MFLSVTLVDQLIVQKEKAKLDLGLNSKPLLHTA